MSRHDPRQPDDDEARLASPEHAALGARLEADIEEETRKVRAAYPFGFHPDDERPRPPEAPLIPTIGQYEAEAIARRKAATEEDTK